MLDRIIVPEENVGPLVASVAKHKKRVGLLVERCRRVQEALTNIRETPDILNILSGAEIRTMNLLDRKISEIIPEIERLKPLVVTEDYQLVSEKHEAEFVLIEDALEKTWSCIEEMEAKIPEPEFNIYAWFDSPLFVTTYLIRRSFYRLTEWMRKK